MTVSYFGTRFCCVKEDDPMFETWYEKHKDCLIVFPTIRRTGLEAESEHVSRL